MGVVCTRHPNETPQPGICPSCLRERLSRLIAAKHSKLTYNITSSPPSVSVSPPVYFYGYSFASSSGGSSPPPRHHQRVASDIMDSIYLLISGSSGLKKSRSSMANYAPRNDVDAVNHKKKGAFWKKLLLIRSNSKKAKFW